MSAEPAVFVRSWRVGRWTCTLTVPQATRGVVRSAVTEWAPSFPTELSPEERAQYRAGRNAALAELAQHLGGKVAVLDV